MQNGYAYQELPPNYGMQSFYPWNQGVNYDNYDGHYQNFPDKCIQVRQNGAASRLNLPCKSNSDWDYNQCYSYYANGCYNTCQFVNMGDIEDFM